MHVDDIDTENDYADDDGYNNDSDNDGDDDYSHLDYGLNLAYTCTHLLTLAYTMARFFYI